MTPKKQSRSGFPERRLGGAPLNILPPVCGALPSRRYDGIISSSPVWRLHLPARLERRPSAPPESAMTVSLWVGGVKEQND
jgi:hypothetical protein